MKDSINGKNVVKDMRDLARSYFKDSRFEKAGCVCVGVAHIGARGKGGRSKDGGERVCYVAASGKAGRTFLKETLTADGLLGQTDSVEALLEIVANEVVVYRSSTVGTRILKQESWSTHNCAESALACYLYRHGIPLGKITIASYESVNGTIGYKPLCHNCAQWCQNQFAILDDFRTHSR